MLPRMCPLSNQDNATPLSGTLHLTRQDTSCCTTPQVVHVYIHVGYPTTHSVTWVSGVVRLHSTSPPPQTTVSIDTSSLLHWRYQYLYNTLNGPLPSYYVHGVSLDLCQVGWGDDIEMSVGDCMALLATDQLTHTCCLEWMVRYI